MIVVRDTSPLTNLRRLDSLIFYANSYEELHIPEGVWAELNAEGKRWPGADEVEAASWVKRHAVQNESLVTALRRDLGQGEAEGIALALELGADLILLDENEGRHAAQRMGLRVVGVVGVLLDAKARGAVAEIRPQLDALRQKAGFYLSEALYQAALASADESS